MQGRTAVCMRVLASLVLVALLAGCQGGPWSPLPGPSLSDEAVFRPPEAAGPLQGARAAARFRHEAVAAAHPLAADAGRRMLAAGGSAVDAAVAVQMMLTVVEPQSSGIGGGAFLLVSDGGSVQAWDGRETAPVSADERRFLDAEGRPLAFADAVTRGRSVGVPGAVALLAAAHRVHGRLPWAQLFEPAIQAAEQGVPVGPRLQALLAAETALPRDPRARAHFYAPDGQPWPVGHVLRNPALAAVLRELARDGAAALYSGPIARDLVARVRERDAEVPGPSLADLAAYRPRQREALCTDWRSRWRVCGMPPPSSGHLTVMQILGQLEQLPPSLQRLSHPAQVDGRASAGWLHVYAEAARRAHADRALYMADPDFVSAPGGRWSSLLDPDYLRGRAAGIGERASQPEAGVPQAAAGQAHSYAAMPEQPESGTSHVSVVDGQGQAVAMTTSIEAAFGARLMIDGGSGLPGGFLLNNQLTDFSFVPRDATGRPVANRVEGGKRPRSSMSPTLVFDRATGDLLASLGSPGGAAIIHYTARTLWSVFEQALDPQVALDQPNFVMLGGPLLLEQGRFPPATLEALRARGHTVQEAALTSGLQALVRRGGAWAGGADPRREGAVLGR